MFNSKVNNVNVILKYQISRDKKYYVLMTKYCYEPHPHHHSRYSVYRDEFHEKDGNGNKREETNFSFPGARVFHRYIKDARVFRRLNRRCKGIPQVYRRCKSIPQAIDIIDLNDFGDYSVFCRWIFTILNSNISWTF